MEQLEIQELEKAIHKAEEAFFSLIAKLEKDGYIKYEGQSFCELLKEELEELVKLLQSGRTLAKNDAREYVFPGGFITLTRFDRMAQEFGASFWERMKVQNPGYISILYLNLLEAKGKMVTEKKLLPENFDKTVELFRTAIDSPYFN